MSQASGVATRLDDPRWAVAVLIVGALLFRLGFAWSTGLGIDESYMVAAGRHVQWGYYDHPPIAWWLAWAAGRVFGGDPPIVVRLPFLALFALSTWLMFRFTARLFSPRAGFWAAVLFNLSPVFGLTSATWVLPDGPMFAALLGAALCFHAAGAARGGAAWRWWLGAGVCGGLALLSKYTAILPMVGASFVLARAPTFQFWRKRPHPYVAGMIALGIFLPVIWWNVTHHWASFGFQAGRVGGGRWHVLGPLTTLAGEILFLLPWIGAPLLYYGCVALRRGRQSAEWFLACLGLPAIVLFLVVSLKTHVLFHWADSGFLMLFPLLGQEVARHLAVRRWIVATAGFVVLGATLVASDVHYNWLPALGERFTHGVDPGLAAVDWTSIAADMAGRVAGSRAPMVIATVRWHDAGKIDYALGGAVPVICLGRDPREYGILSARGSYVGRDVLIVAPNTAFAAFRRVYGGLFDSVSVLPPSALRHGGRVALEVPIFLGHNLHPAWRTSAGR